MATAQELPTKDPLFLLTADQAAQTKFPVGCPVHYHFRRSSRPPAVTESRAGTVAAVSLNAFQKRFVFRIARRRDSSGGADGTPSMEDADEDDVAYALGCPVTIAVGEEKSEVKIVFVKPLTDPDGKVSMSYIVQYAVEENDNMLRMEEGVTPDRLSFKNRVAKGTNKSDEHHASNASPLNMAPSKQGTSSRPAMVPSLSSNSSEGGHFQKKVASNKVGRAIEPNKKRKASSKSMELPAKNQLNSPPTKAVQQKVTPTRSQEQFKLHPKLPPRGAKLPQADVYVRQPAPASHRAAAKPTSPQSDGVTSPLTCELSEADGTTRTEGSRERPRKQQKHGQTERAGATLGARVWAEEGEITERRWGKEGVSCQLTVPLWVTDVPGDSFRDRCFTHLIGKAGGVTGHKAKIIFSETSCKVHLSRFNREARQPMRITVTPLGPLANVEKAIGMLEDDLSDYVGESSAGRLRFELRAGAAGPVVSRAASGAVRTSGGRWLQLLELPCIDRRRIVRTADGGLRLDRALQQRVWDDARCSAELFVDCSKMPVARCKPYALVQGRELRQVERAAAMITNARLDPSCGAR